MNLLLACSGHLLVDLPIFMGPVVVLAGWILLMTRRARRSERGDRVETLQTHNSQATNKLFGVQA